MLVNPTYHAHITAFAKYSAALLHYQHVKLHMSVALSVAIVYVLRHLTVGILRLLGVSNLKISSSKTRKHKFSSSKKCFLMSLISFPQQNSKVPTGYHLWASPMSILDSCEASKQASCGGLKWRNGSKTASKIVETCRNHSGFQRISRIIPGPFSQVSTLKHP